MTEEERRAYSLGRDEACVRRALDSYDADRFDLDAVRQVVVSVHALTETLGFIAVDESFWAQLRRRADVIGERQIEALDRLDDASLGTMFTLVGYRCPPPPPIEELVADTRHAVGYALRSGTTTPEGISLAQKSLITFILRTRRDVEAAVGKNKPVECVPVARQVARMARKMIPVTAGIVAAGVTAHFFPPASGVTYVGVKGVVGSVRDEAMDEAAHRTGEALADLGVEVLLGSGLIEGNPDVLDAGPDPIVTPGRAMRAHVAQASHLAQTMQSSLNRRGRFVERDADDLEAHLFRVAALIRDHGGAFEVRDAVDIALACVQMARRTDMREARYRQQQAEILRNDSAAALDPAAFVRLAVQSLTFVVRVLASTDLTRPFADPPAEPDRAQTVNSARLTNAWRQLMSVAYPQTVNRRLLPPDQGQKPGPRPPTPWGMGPS